MYDRTIARFDSSEYCFVNMHTLLSIHKSRLASKVADEKNFIAKVPGASAIFCYGTKPNAQKKYDTTIELLCLVNRDIAIPFAEKLGDFRLEWDKRKEILITACDLDMPFSAASKQGQRVVSRIDKLLLKIDSFLEIDTTPTTPTGRMIK